MFYGYIGLNIMHKEVYFLLQQEDGLQGDGVSEGMSSSVLTPFSFCFFFQAEDGIRDTEL